MKPPFAQLLLLGSLLGPCMSALSLPKGISIDSGTSRLRGTRVVFLLGADCPVSRQYIPVIREIARSWQAKGLREISIVFCNGAGYGRRRSVRAFMKVNGLDIRWRTDPGNRLARRMGAKVVPEVFVFRSGERMYSGAIDDMFAGLGQRRAFTTEHYLIEALEACRAGRRPPLTTRPAYGCLVE